MIFQKQWNEQKSNNQIRRWVGGEILIVFLLFMHYAGVFHVVVPWVSSIYGMWLDGIVACSGFDWL